MEDTLDESFGFLSPCGNAVKAFDNEGAYSKTSICSVGGLEILASKVLLVINSLEKKAKKNLHYLQVRRIK